MRISLIIAALLPSLILLGYVLYQDRMRPEPPRLLFRAFVLGILSTLLSSFISTPLMSLGVFSMSPEGILGNLRLALFGAAIPEECAKLFVLWLILRNNPYFDEHFDGIVYAVCVGMGFAFIENVGYLVNAGDLWVHAGIARGVISVPGHYAFAILMGYHYSYSHFDQDQRSLHRFLTLAAPITAHAVFDWILMVSDTTDHPLFSSILSILFLVGFVQLQKIGRNGIRAHLTKDNDKFV